MSGRLKPEAQLTDGIAKRELALLGGSNAVFKFLCPMLVKPDLGEAQATEGEKARLSQRKGSVTNPSFRTLSGRAAEGKPFSAAAAVQQAQTAEAGAYPIVGGGERMRQLWGPH